MLKYHRLSFTKLNSRTPLYILASVAAAAAAVVVGVASSKHDYHHSNVSPIIKPYDQVRICANLCSAGLGGEPCGDFCFDLTPTRLPRQSLNDTELVGTTAARTAVCPILCDNRLGHPLCKCHEPTSNNRHGIHVNFNKICDHYCSKQKWWLRGCPPCKLTTQHGGTTQNGRISMDNLVKTDSSDIDWGKWCKKMCADDNGGSACNCDILPFSLQLKP